MLTVLMETRDQETELVQTLSVLVSGAVEGLVSSVVILDHGSRDASSQVADAAGCTFLTQWELAEVLRAARGEWLLILEPGARPLTGWIADIADYIQSNRLPARFSLSRHHRPPLWTRLVRRRPAFEHGLLLPRREALAPLRPGASLVDLAGKGRMNRLKSEIVPASVNRK